MRTRLRAAILAATCATAIVILGSTALALAQGQGGLPRTADGRPDLNGIWQAMGTAHWNIQAHAARQGPVSALGAAFSVPPGVGVVEGGEVPYQPWAAAKQKENSDNWISRDPEIKCFMPGIPRATYMPYPFQIVQSPATIVMAYEFANTSRIVRMNSKEKSPTATWMGWSIGHWEKDTLVITVSDQVEDTWFDRAGNFHSDALRVVERFSLVDANTLGYHVTIEDPKVFTRTWTMNMLLYRRREPNAQLMEYRCVPFAEELMYGHLRKQPAK